MTEAIFSNEGKDFGLGKLGRTFKAGFIDESLKKKVFPTAIAGDVKVSKTAFLTFFFVVQTWKKVFAFRLLTSDTMLTTKLFGSWVVTADRCNLLIKKKHCLTSDINNITLHFETR